MRNPLRIHLSSKKLNWLTIVEKARLIIGQRRQIIVNPFTGCRNTQANNTSQQRQKLHSSYNNKTTNCYIPVFIFSTLFTALSNIIPKTANMKITISALTIPTLSKHPRPTYHNSQPNSTNQTMVHGDNGANLWSKPTSVTDNDPLSVLSHNPKPSFVSIYPIYPLGNSFHRTSLLLRTVSLRNP